MFTDLVKLADHLDQMNLRREADYLDQIIKTAIDLEPTHLPHDETGDRTVQSLSPEDARKLLASLESDEEEILRLSENISSLLDAVNLSATKAAIEELDNHNFGVRWRDTNTLEQEVHDPRVRGLYEDLAAIETNLRNQLDLSDIFHETKMSLNHIIDGTG